MWYLWAMIGLTAVTLGIILFIIDRQAKKRRN